MEKVCTRCHLLKPAKAFFRNRSKADGLSTQCGKCDLEGKKLRRLREPELVRKLERERRGKKKDQYRRRDKERYCSTKRRNCALQKKYGIGIEQFQDLLVSQSRGCGICLSREPDGKGWHVDHCHETGKVRGILCGYCNRMLGFAKDRPEVLLAAISYLRLTSQPHVLPNRWSKQAIDVLREKLLVEQQGRCAICLGTEPKSRHGVFHVDHNHETKVVRGVLCHPCNSLLGSARDTTWILESGVSYLLGLGREVRLKAS